MSHVIILARTTSEGNAYVRAHRDELPTGRHIVPTSAAQIDGVVPHLVIELPGFRDRRDRHAVLATVKRSSRKYQACEWRTVGAPVHFVSNGAMLHAMPDTAGAHGVDTPEDVTCEICVQILETDGLPAKPPVNFGKVLRIPQAKPQWLRDLEADGIIEPEGWEPPETLNAEQILRLAAGETGAEVAPVVDPFENLEDTPAPKRRRSKCKSCGKLHFSDEAC